MREYYDYGVRLDERRWYLLWFSNEVDGVATEDGQVLGFVSREAARAFARDRDWTLAASEPGREQPLLQLDRVASWVAQPRKTIDARLFLNSWNLLLDIANSVGAHQNLVVVRYTRDAESDVYDKLFWGNNLPSVTPKGHHYRPLWSGAEVLELRDILSDGLMLLRRVLRPVTFLKET